MKTCIASVLIIICTALNSDARLEWEKEVVKLKAHPLQETMQLQFSYENSGAEAVEIIKIDASCGCLVPRSGKRVVQPGERGSLDIEFSLKGRSGKQKKYIQVYTTQASKVPIRLNIEVDIPESYLPSIKRVVWERAAAYEPKTVRLKNNFHQPIKLVEALPTIGTLKAELVVVKPGFEYDLIVIPDPGVENMRAYVRLKTVPFPEMGKAKDFKVYIFIK